MPMANENDAMREWARNVGGYDRFKDSAWLLTDYDVWVRNPHYSGPPQKHPEDDSGMYEEDFSGYYEPDYDFNPPVVSTDDDLPF